MDKIRPYLYIKKDTNTI